MDIKKTVAAIGCSGLLWAASATSPKSFSTPQQAMEALVQAADHHDKRALLSLFGPDGQDIVESGDASDDAEGRKVFVRLAREHTEFIPDPMDRDKTIISIGQQDWPFPIPLIRMKDDQWQFDAAQGRKEILARRIGSNEMNAVDICHGFVEAENDYAETHRHQGVPEYSQHIEASTTIPKAFTDAVIVTPHAHPEPYHGYYFRVLTAQGPEANGGEVNYLINGSLIGGFALVAWPAKYGISGVQTFIVNADNQVYEKHLGPDTDSIARAMTTYDPDPSWKRIRSD